MTVIVIDHMPADLDNAVTICETNEEVASVLESIAMEHEVTDETVSIYVLGDHISVTQFM